MAYLTKRFKKLVKTSHGLTKHGNIGRQFGGIDLCHGCGKPGYFIRECPHERNDNQEGQRAIKDRRMDKVSDKYKRKAAADNIMIKASEVWGNSSSGSEEEERLEDASMLFVRDDDQVYKHLF